mmetsp:Transcript_22829/g.71558  ORF Transcript_22829/g.71558 Transcript_22829/m.71558 type:complete len:127 (-) Transcript_22829:164-544(-)
MTHRTAPQRDPPRSPSLPPLSQSIAVSSRPPRPGHLPSSCVHLCVTILLLFFSPLPFLDSPSVRPHHPETHTTTNNDTASHVAFPTLTCLPDRATTPRTPSAPAPIGTATPAARRSRLRLRAAALS